MAIFDLPFQSNIDASSGPASEGFGMDVISYGSKLSQKSFTGPDQESSKEAVWKIIWKGIKFDKDSPLSNDFVTLRTFYDTAHAQKVRYKPFEQPTAIWEIVPASLRRKHIGSNFEISMSLQYLYDE